MKSTLILLLILLLFSSCSQETKEPLNMPTLTEQGVNLLNEKTLFKINSIAPKLLGYDLDMFTAWENGKSNSVISVRYRTLEVMVITPTLANENAQQYIKSISITSNFIKNPFSLKIGEIYKREDFSTCQEIQESIICKKEDFNNIELIFKKNSSHIWLLKEIQWSLSAS